ncbi:hypothetical protein CERSUDRAFT_99756 [Gelatoporia subvermispora B]|uniref:F-box domain-containing protein n=1 Tax=Ceriporiopsis subvermispora (strain B) TaxID=914234 RepID=M2Q5H2_CERS8|nr:hypothetical protein CERSUDRAFT_99756 [Gelatoporia subvermispora B]
MASRGLRSHQCLARLLEILNELDQLDKSVFCMNHKELKEMESALATASTFVQSLMNTPPPINRLPPEILSDIFLRVPGIQKRPFRSQSPFIECAEALPLTHVCSYWREVAINMPYLWAHIRAPSLIDFSLTRSRGVPLHVIWCRENATRVESLLSSGVAVQELCCYDGSMTPDRIDYPARFLKTLHMEDCLPAGDEDVSLFRDQTPSLRQVVIIRCAHFPTNSFADLTYLCIEQCAAPIRLSRILSLFSASPSLEKLTLWEVDLQDDSGPTHVVSLPMLRYIDLKLQKVQSAEILVSHLALSAKIGVLLYGHSFSALKSVSGLIKNTTKLIVALNQDVFHAIAMGTVGQSAGVHAATQVGNPTSISGLLDIVDKAISFPRIRTLMTKGYSAFDKTKMFSILRKLTSLTALTVDNTEAWDDDILLALFWYCEDNITPLCPKLTTVRILTENIADDSTILALAEARFNQGYPISELIIESYDQVPAIEGINKFVSKVRYKTIIGEPDVPYVIRGRRTQHTS